MSRFIKKTLLSKYSFYGKIEKIIIKNTLPTQNYYV